jgi:phosphoribosylanthranilate isomerase
MTRIKICGITNHDDAEVAARSGADAIGFVFANSPRKVAPEIARDIMRELDPFVTGVGVFVDRPVTEVCATLEQTGCKVAQLHGNEPPSYINDLRPYRVVKVIRVAERLDETQVSGYKGVGAILLDTFVAGLAGGTGRRFDPALAVTLIEAGWRVIIAGGLTPENVGDLVTSVRPYGVDVSGGVESTPGRKDHTKVAEFIAAVRAADRGGG